MDNNGLSFSFSFNLKRGKMYRQGLTSISAPLEIYNQICKQIKQNATIETEIVAKQTVIFSTVRPIGYLYKQIEGRTALRLALKQMIYERIDELTGEVKYFLTLETGYRFGKPPVYVITDDVEISAARYSEYLTLTPYSSFQRKETTFIDKATKRRYVMSYTYDGSIITFNQFSKNVNENFDLPEYIKAIIYADGDKWEQNFHVVQAKWREKQEAAIAARKAEIQAKKDLEKAERKRKAEEKKKARVAAKKASQKTKKSATKSAKATTPKTPKPVPEKKKKEETVTDMWAAWGKGKK